ncbi:MAG: LexA family transcriptional regulator [Planctomyces sp.]|nr:LexA family transcriptional regulator [Planctomyces sp.]
MSAICERLKDLRERLYGVRGRSAFARDLQVPVSTYSQYEQDRIPPADVLHRAASLARVRLEWLITGDGEALAGPRNGVQSPLAVRVEALLQARPELASPLSGMLDALERASGPGESAKGRSRSQRAPEDRKAWIPIVGSTAAGPARYWSELPGVRESASADARLRELIERAAAGDLQKASARFEGLTPEIPSAAPMLLQCSEPDERGILEFVAAASLKARDPRCVAWRIDGDSMEPRFRDGDLVVASPSFPVVDGQPCIARQRGQIGVNCKLFRREGDEALLIPINERHVPQRIPADSLEWAHPIIGVVRPMR